MTAFEKFETLREYYPDRTILEEIGLILSTDDLDQLCDDIAHNFNFSFDDKEDDGFDD